jgi:ABC-type branched-subunit amino acid transport system ATPase component
MLQIKNLNKKFGGVKAVKDCSFEVKENEIVALIGPNGAGKTTVFNLLTGFIKPDKGHVHYKGTPLLGVKPHKISNLGITRTFQLIKLLPKLTLVENLLIAKQQSGEHLLNIIFKPKYIKHEEKENRKHCIELLDLVGLKDKRNHYAKNLSYGQQKLVEIARILATDADLLLLDEPVAGVNPVMREKIRSILKKLKKQGKTILFIEHDMKFVMDIADRVIVLDHGTEIANGIPKQIQKNPRVLQAYLGKKVKL